MKRFDVAGCTGYCYGGYHMKEDVDGEYVTYESHVEAMKRIAGDGAQQAEPVAWHIGNPDGTMNKLGAIYHNRKSAIDHFDSYGGDFNCCIVPLYAAPPVEAMKRIAGASPWASVNPATTLADRIGDLPEINFSNYNESDVEALNEWAIEAYTLLAATPAQQDETIAQPTDEQILLLAANFMDANSFEHNKAEFVRWFRKLLTEPAPVGEMPFSKAHEIVSMLDVQTRAQLESLARRSHGGRFPVYMSPDDARALLAASPADQVEDARDAARYRFIKESRLILSGGTTTFGWAISPFGEQCDRYIDAAMSASKEGA